MKLLEKLKNIDKKYPWGFFGVIFTFFLFYYGLNYEKSAQIEFDVFNSSNVIEMREDIKNLNILYENENIKQNNLNLKLIFLKLSNTGNINILQSYYDYSAPWGFRITDGNLVSIDIIESNSEYLKSSINPKIIDKKTVELNKVIFEKKNYITFKILILHSKEKAPIINTFGKIAGIEKFKFIESFKNVKSSFKRNLLFFLISIAGFIFFLALVTMVGTRIDSILTKRKKNKRKKQVESFKKNYPIGNSSCQEYVFDKFIEHGDEIIRKIIYIIDRKYFLNFYFQFFYDSEEYKRKDEKAISLFYENMPYEYTIVIYEFIKNGLVTKPSNGLSVDVELTDFLNLFYNYIQADKTSKIKI